MYKKLACNLLHTLPWDSDAGWSVRRLSSSSRFLKMLTERACF